MERTEDRWQDVKIQRDRELKIDREKGEERAQEEKVKWRQEEKVRRKRGSHMTLTLIMREVSRRR